MSWFVDPTDVARLTLDLPGDEWVEVKRELSFAEEQALMGAMMGDFKATGKKGQKDVLDASMGWDMKRYQIERFATWLVGWSAVSPSGKPAEITRDTIANLRADVAAAIDKALDAHVEALEEAKKATTGAKAPPS